MHTRSTSGDIFIYYSMSDVILGTALLILVFFFIQNYLSHTIGPERENDIAWINQLYEESTSVNKTTN